MTDLVDEQYTLTVLRDGESSLPRAMSIRLGGPNGQFQSPPDGRPAHVVFDKQGRIERMGWYHENRLHRIDAPALMEINPENGVVFSEEYRVYGNAHRSYHQPALTERDPITGEIQSEYYFIDDELVEPRLPSKLDLTP